MKATERAPMQLTDIDIIYANFMRKLQIKPCMTKVIISNYG